MHNHNRITRKLQFYRTVLMNTDQRVVAPDQTFIWDRLSKWPYFTDEGPVRLLKYNGERRSVSVKPAYNKFEGAFYRTRLSDLPMQEGPDGNVKELDIGDEDGLVFKNHFIWWDFSNLKRSPSQTKDEKFGILAWEQHPDGVRVPGLTDYINEKFHHLKRMIVVNPIMDATALRRLSDQKVIGAITIRTGRSPTNPFMDLWGSAPSECKTIELKFSPPRGERFEAADVVDRLLSWRDLSEVEKLTAQIAEGEVLDLLHEKLDTEIQIERNSERSKSVNSKSAYREIENAFAKNRDSLATINGRIWDSSGSDHRLGQ